MAWTPYQAPGVALDQYAFFRPQNSAMPTGQAQLSYLTPGTDSQETRRTVKFDGGLTREAIGNSTNFLNNQLGQLDANMATGFQGVNTGVTAGFGTQLKDIQGLFDRFGSLGGLGGMTSSPVYRPGGQTVDQTAQQQGTNGQPLPWAAANPFKATF